MAKKKKAKVERKQKVKEEEEENEQHKGSIREASHFSSTHEGNGEG